MLLSRVLVVAGALFLVTPVSASPNKHAASSSTIIEFSHLIDEAQAERLEPLIDQFNSQQKDVVVKLVRRVEGEAPKQINLVNKKEYARYMRSKA